MSPYEAEKIIQDYGSVLEISSAIGLAIPEQFLPHPKSKIKEAVFLAYETADEENKQILASCYMRLPEFVPMDEALVVYRYTNWLTSEDKSKNHQDEHLRDEWQKIVNRVNKEMEEYLKDITR